MLVLTRRVGESVLIGDDIEITLVRIEGDQVRIGVTAPKQVPVYRKELVDAVRQENIRAAAAAQHTLPAALENLTEAEGETQTISIVKNAEQEKKSPEPHEQSGKKSPEH